MLMYFLIGLSLVLIGIVGLQFSYMFYIERIYRERRTYLRDLELKHARLTERLKAAERRITEQDELLGTVLAEEDAWADVIEER